ncbi:Type 1 glutamine amidotransferase-like domain-containing protein [Paenibacillus pini]|uniref:Peptidase E n=1 Tax=Paenibacillus pini JCM 16418 TaxID=1236976 RepID=W7YXM2_9BACL|nr:peptidase E [Paenibacillus pini]GAF09426.1 peptidase E [Paenibacillus pini JCM 16418]
MKQIIAMGGGGFSMEPDNPLLDQYILKQSSQKQPKVCFIPTASGDAEGYIEGFYQAFEKHSCVPSHLSLFNLPTADLEDYILDKDIIYVGGGNTTSLLALWRHWELDKYLQKAWEQGVILSGLSAGSLCWFEEGVSDCIPGQSVVINGLGLVKGSHSPHYDNDPMYRREYHRLLLEGQICSGIAASDGVAIHYIDDHIQKIVSSRPDARAYEVECIHGEIRETPVIPFYLGD